MFSVVIPTHNRLDLLRDAIETVRRQDYSDWELVVFDNGSTENIGQYVKDIADARIRYERSDDFLPVTQSWNRAIDLARGSHVTFLGDDDGLAPDYFTGVRRVLEQFDSPEIVYCGLYQFMHPGVAPWERRGYVADVRNGFFFVGRDAPFRLSRGEISKAVDGSLALRRNFTFNIQAFCFSADFLNRLRMDGPVFRSPFPDYYLANIALAKASSVVVVPAPMSIAGVSRESFGFTLFNDMEQRGAELLNAKLAQDPLYAEVEKFLLPGPLYNTNYALTMEHVAQYAGELVGRGVHYQKYRRLQIYSLLRAVKEHPWETDAGKFLWSRLSAAEKFLAKALQMILFTSRTFGLRGLVERVLQRLLGMYGFHPKNQMSDMGRYSRLIQVFEAMQSGKIIRPALLVPAAKSNA